MYTKEMAEAFHALTTPENFGVELYDNDQWITVVVSPESLLNRTEEQLNEIVKYINDVKISLENNGAHVLVTRDAIEE